MANADIKVHKNGDSQGNAFSPDSFPTSGTVQQNTKITFLSAGDTSVVFFAQSGLFYKPNGESNKGTDPFVAPAANATTPLTLTVAMASACTCWLSLSSNNSSDSCGGDGTPSSNNSSDSCGGDGTPSDGKITVSQRPTMYEDVIEPRPREGQPPVSLLAMQAVDAD
ncbi:MAG TPA: hypothetical protein VFP84_06585 [Kofleriaceae bacterium]|nr:hypothetical protein [Kofleriaceae bacterium]